MYVYDPNTCRYIAMGQTPGYQPQWDWQRLTHIPWAYQPATFTPLCAYWMPQQVVAPMYDPYNPRPYNDPTHTQQVTNNPNPNDNPNFNTNTCTNPGNNPQDNPVNTGNYTQTRPYTTPYGTNFPHTMPYFWQNFAPTTQYPQYPMTPYMTMHQPMNPHLMPQYPMTHFPMCYYPTWGPTVHPIQMTTHNNWTPWNYHTPYHHPMYR